MGFRNSKIFLISVAGLSAAIFTPVFAAGGGGGGGGGGGNLSESVPAYDPAVEYQKGTAAFQAGNYAEAAKAFKRVVRAVPKNAQANYLLGASYMALSDFKKAKAPLISAVRQDAKSVEARRDLGIVQARLGAPDKAGEQLVALKAMAAACGSGCADSAKLSEAIAKLDAAIAGGKSAAGAIAPSVRLAASQSADATYVTAVGLINEKRFDEAIIVLNRALWAAGPHPDILTYLGFANRKLKKYDLAEGYYRAALAVAPNHRGAIEYYGELKLERGNVAGATAHLARLEAICGFGCAEADELRRWIKEAKASAS